jgi:hypothetical protein
MDLRLIFGDDYPEAYYRDSLNDIWEIVEQKELRDAIMGYQNDMMSVFPTFFTKKVYDAITGDGHNFKKLAEAVGISALMSAPLDDVIDEDMPREKRASHIHTGIILSVVGIVNLTEQLRLGLDEEKVNKIIKYYLQAAIDATEGNENEMYEERFSFEEYTKEYQKSLTVPFLLPIKVACVIADKDGKVESNLMSIGTNLGLMLRVLNDIDHFDKHIKKGFVSLPIKYLKENKMDLLLKKNQKYAIQKVIEIGLKAAEDAEKTLNETDLKNRDGLRAIIHNFKRAFELLQRS